MDRRSFLRRVASFSVAASVPLGIAVRAAVAQAREVGSKAAQLGLGLAAPIQVLPESAPLSSTEFNGDEPNGAHEVLWDVAGFLRKKGGIPAPSEEADVVILGGGQSGLASAYLLRDRKPVLLEQASQFGGNAKGERFRDSTFPIGAVYISEPEEGSEVQSLLNELGLLRAGRAEAGNDTTVFYDSKFTRGFWDAATNSGNKAQFHAVFAELSSWLTDPGKVAVLDYKSGILSAEARRLDSLSFAEWLEGKFGQLDPGLLEYFQLYGWSSFLGSIQELSALQALSFLSGETGKSLTFPGGLAAIAQGMYEKLTAELGEKNLRASCLAVDVRKSGDKVQICYKDKDGNLRTILAKACIFAGAKFIGEKIIQGVSDEQRASWKRINYRAYVVANVIFDGPIQSPSFSLYCLQGNVPADPTFMNPPARAFSDICFASWAARDRAQNGALTVFSGMPFDGSNQILFSPGAHDAQKRKILDALEPVLRALGKTRDNILGIRLTRWGHPIPVAYKGLVASGVLQQARAPIDSMLYFVNQDNWANPCFETVFDEASAVAEAIRAKL